MKFAKNLLVVGLVALIVCCTLFGCCTFREGLENQTTNETETQTETTQTSPPNCSEYTSNEDCTEHEGCGWLVNKANPTGVCILTSPQNCSEYISNEDCTEHEECGWLVNKANPAGVCIYAPTHTN